MSTIEARDVLPAHQLPEVIITVQQQHVASQSIPAEKRFVFAYHVDIYNASHHTLQLLNRHWLITDGNGKLEEVQGEGVVGEMPIIAPGDSYQYSSGAVLNTEVGSMSGQYGMRICLEGDDDGLAFNAQIPVFTLAVPSALN